MAHILVVDDDPDVLALCRLILSSAGHLVREAPDGRAAMGLIEHQRFDAFVLDLMMPALDGYQVLDALRRRDGTREVPVVILTAKTQREDQIRSWRQGASEFLTKPFTPDQLVIAVERAMSTDADQLAQRRSAALRELAAHRPS